VVDTIIVNVTPTDPKEQAAQAELNYQAMWADIENRRHRKDFALFQVDLDIKEGRVQLTSKPQSYIDLPLAIFDKSLALLQDIPQLEMVVMDHLFLAGDQARLGCPAGTNRGCRPCMTRPQPR